MSIFRSHSVQRCNKLTASYVGIHIFQDRDFFASALAGNASTHSELNDGLFHLRLPT